MSEVARAKISDRGNMRCPKKVMDYLDVKPGDYLIFEKNEAGMLVVSKGVIVKRG